MLKGKAIVIRDKKGISEFIKHKNDKKKFEYRVIRFGLKDWLSLYVDMNAKKRIKSTIGF